MPQLFVPISGGLAEATEERVARPDHPTRLRNVRFDKLGGVRCRRGFRSRSRELQNGLSFSSLPTVRTLFSTGTELCAVTAHDVFAYSDNFDAWLLRGPSPLGSGRVRPCFRDERSYDLSDCAEANGFVIRCAERNRRAVGSLTDLRDMAAMVDEVDGSRVVQLAETGFDVGSSPHSPRCSSVGDYLVAMWVTSSGPANIRYSLWDSSLGPGTQLTSPGILVNDLYFSITGVRTYDADSSGGVMALAYVVHGSREIHVTLQAVPTIDLTTLNLDDGLYQLVAVHHDSDDEAVYVLAVCPDRNTSNLEILAYRLSTTGGTLALDWGPVVVYTQPDDTLVLTNIGIRRDPDSGTLAMVWTEMDSSLGGNSVAMYSRMPSDNSASPTAPETRYNLATQSRPFWYQGRPFSACSTTVAIDTLQTLASGGYAGNGVWSPVTGGLGNIFECEVVMRWPHGVTLEAENAWVVGAYNIGYAESQTMGHGSTHSVYRVDEAARWMTTATSRSVEALTVHMCDEVEVLPDDAPLAAQVERGRACIGGSLVTWYDGESTMELGHLTAPVPSQVVESDHNLGAPISAGTYFYTAVFYGWDASGALHRSAPSMTAEKPFVGGGSNDSIELYARTTPATNRWAHRGSYCVWHKAVNDIQVRLTPPLQIIPNTVTGQFELLPGYDDGQSTADTIQETLYTAGGELENIAPEGARIPAVAGGRLWLGGSMRRSRVAFSKPFSPGTASEYAIAPEMNEGFAVPLPDGAEVTGLGTIDDNLVVFTDSAVYLISATGGPDDAGGGARFEARRVSSDSGCVEPRSVVAFPGGLMYQSAAGIHVIDHSFGVKFIGDAVGDLTADFPIITSATLVPDQGEVRFTATNEEGDDGRVIVYDYEHNAWIEWVIGLDGESNAVPVASCYHQPVTGEAGNYVVACGDGTLLEESANHLDPSGEIVMALHTGWVQAAQHGGWQRVRNITALCERVGNTNPSLSVDTDFSPGTGSGQTHEWSDFEVQGFPRLPDAELRMKVIDQKSGAFRIRYEDTVEVEGGGMVLTGFMLDVVEKRGQGKVSLAQKG